MRDWDLRQTWGWDFPMMAMTAARLGLRERRSTCCCATAPTSASASPA